MKAEFILIQDKLKWARNIKKITQRELAEICNVSEKTIHRAENEANKLEFETLLLIADKLKVEIKGYLYKKAFSLDEVWNVIEEISIGAELKVHPVKFNIEQLDIVIRIVEILERDLKKKSNSIKLRTQRFLILENEKLKKSEAEGYYTIFIENNIKILNLYFLNSKSEKIKIKNERKYIEVFKEFTLEM
ncbi:helix-turn-helix transcriptional regulator [Cetobacterium sp. 2A]|uniref:helix-turn-helix domain-containing protein n=1 Tax=Cetobacterium sp. 2A TaxID=2754723 RepID=UPI00163D3097|nr:helix-turn-helix transcriptional regulator [Cetobacterium sp. 2A]MBC2857076.1 helix-turn-helix transcriptional regulator [Cetobacterium sp. 2A]